MIHHGCSGAAGAVDGFAAGRDELFGFVDFGAGRGGIEGGSFVEGDFTVREELAVVAEREAGREELAVVAEREAAREPAREGWV